MGAATSDRTAAAECISDDALIHLKSYKYSAVDKSPISNYILRPYVRNPSDNPPPSHCLSLLPCARRPSGLELGLA
ncbi:hypothetical protein LX32DRAFT_631872 [Colletotrichum zoysiae]|uniref:Uncharacterized protein n=1 Tax=Colletotrichum zoysiae TaxID=1216348 RepID=A0AAD9H315_9PEZI|nr:hypothetical protein LX32DRAFT_631872 [Colletotrichum zoysiae]